MKTSQFFFMVFWGAMLSSILSYSQAVAEPIKFVDIRTPLKYYFTAVKSGGQELLLKGSDTIERFSVKDRVFYREVVHWYYEKNKKHKYEDAIMIKKGDYVASLYLLRTVTNADGKVIREEENIFDPEKHTVRVIRRYNDLAKEDDWGLDTNMDKVFNDIPEDTYIKTMLNMCLRSIPMQKDLEFNMHMITRLGMLFRIYYKVESIEQITVPAGSFVCYRIKQSPEANIAAGLIKVPHALSPSQSFWYSTQEPLQLIKYKGYEEEPAQRSHLGPILSGDIEVMVDKVEPLGIDNLEDKTLLLEKMRLYKLIPD